MFGMSGTQPTSEHVLTRKPCLHVWYVEHAAKNRRCSYKETVLARLTCRAHSQIQKNMFLQGNFICMCGMSNTHQTIEYVLTRKLCLHVWYVELTTTHRIRWSYKETVFACLVCRAKTPKYRRRCSYKETVFACLVCRAHTQSQKKMFLQGNFLSMFGLSSTQPNIEEHFPVTVADTTCRYQGLAVVGLSLCSCTDLARPCGKPAAR